MIILDKTHQHRIHRRRIDTAVYEGAADTIVVEGTLQDERFLETHHPTDEIRPPFTVHHMLIRMELRLPDLVVVDIEVAMPGVPHAVCSEVRQSLAPVRGLRIAAGFTARVRELVDRKAGCTHLQALLAAMAPAAFQGAWSARVSKPIDQASYARMAGNLKDSCWAWREDGPLVHRLAGSE